jgi:hypothetical protein
VSGVAESLRADLNGRTTHPVALPYLPLFLDMRFTPGPLSFVINGEPVDFLGRRFFAETTRPRLASRVRLANSPTRVQNVQISTRLTCRVIPSSERSQGVCFGGPLLRFFVLAKLAGRSCDRGREGEGASPETMRGGRGRRVFAMKASE